jgi:hypothetical protein
MVDLQCKNEDERGRQILSCFCTADLAGFLVLAGCHTCGTYKTSMKAAANTKIIKIIFIVSSLSPSQT